MKEGRIEDLRTQGQSFGCNAIVIFLVMGFYFLIFAIVELTTNFYNHSFVVSLIESQNVYSANIQPDYSISHSIDIYLQTSPTQYDFRQQHDGANIQQIGRGCYKYSTNAQMNKNKSMLGNPLDDQQQAIPCGFYASLYPQAQINVTTINDTILFNPASPFFQYQTHNFDLSKQWVDLTDPLFLTWLEPNTIVSNTKHWGTLNNIKGPFEISFSMRNLYNNSLSLLFSNNQSLGGYNVPLFIINLAFSLSLFLFALIAHLYETKIPESIISQKTHTLSLKNAFVQMDLSSKLSQL